MPNQDTSRMGRLHFTCYGRNSTRAFTIHFVIFLIIIAKRDMQIYQFPDPTLYDGRLRIRMNCVLSGDRIS